jgi:hypothetical protein
MGMAIPGDNPIPGLDQDARCLARLSARSAHYTDLEVLLQARTELLPASDYRKAVVDENVLSRGSVAARKKVFQELKAATCWMGRILFSLRFTTNGGAVVPTRSVR